jgi:PIN domain nuclease of toxin-antitoxin system
MDTPFPGMDPYLEGPSMWPDVHNRMIVAICDQLQAAIVPSYRAVITPYTVFESIEITPVRAIVPDVGLFERDPLPQTGDTAVALAPAPLTLPAVMTVPTEYARIEIRTVRDHILVTAIELLSPANKRPGQDGADAYEKKRQEIFTSTAHLLELDLLRSGKRPQVARPLPSAPYFIFLSRVQHRPHIEIWPLSLQQAIPLVPVPLRHPDPPVALDLGSAIHDTYRRARYDLEIDYHQPPPPPELTAEDAAWLDAHLHTVGLR